MPELPSPDCRAICRPTSWLTGCRSVRAPVTTLHACGRSWTGRYLRTCGRVTHVAVAVDVDVDVGGGDGGGGLGSRRMAVFARRGRASDGEGKNKNKNKNRKPLRGGERHSATSIVSGDASVHRASHAVRCFPSPAVRVHLERGVGGGGDGQAKVF